MTVLIWWWRLWDIMIVVTIIYYLTISSWEGRMALVLGQYDIYDVHKDHPTDQLIHYYQHYGNTWYWWWLWLWWDGNVNIMMLYSMFTLWWYKIRWQHYGNAWRWWWYCSDADADDIISLSIDDSGGDMVMVMIIIMLNMMLIMMLLPPQFALVLGWLQAPVRWTAATPSWHWTTVWAHVSCRKT